MKEKYETRVWVTQFRNVCFLSGLVGRQTGTLAMVARDRRSPVEIPRANTFERVMFRLSKFMYE